MPAGWYTDPGQTGGKRWWDGTKWTSHLKAPEVVKPKVVAQAPKPYGIGGGDAAGPLINGVPLAAVLSEPKPVYNNKPGWLSLLVGVVAVALTAVTVLSGSIAFWVAGVTVVALLLGARGLSLYSKKQASMFWAPVIGLVFATGATVMAVLGLSILTVMSSAASGLLPAPITTTQIVSIQTSPEPFVFPANQVLTQDGTTLQQIATTINRTYGGGHPTLAAGQAWPELQKTGGSRVLSKDGAVAITMPQGQNFTYRVSADKQSYTVTVSSGKLTEIAIYYSATDRFSFSCPIADTNCLPGR